MNRRHALVLSLLAGAAVIATTVGVVRAAGVGSEPEARSSETVPVSATLESAGLEQAPSTATVARDDRAGQSVDRSGDDRRDHEVSDSRTHSHDWDDELSDDHRWDDDQGEHWDDDQGEHWDDDQGEHWDDDREEEGGEG